MRTRRAMRSSSKRKAVQVEGEGGVSESPNQSRTGEMARKPAEEVANIRGRREYLSSGEPWRKRIGGGRW